MGYFPMNENLPKIPSDRKRAAARANGAKAKGMKTPAGKARSALNAVTHGLTAKTPFLLQNESQKNWDSLYDAYILEYLPATAVEERLVLQLVLCDWRLQRVCTLETAILDLEMSKQRDEIELDYEEISDDTRVAMAFMKKVEALNFISRYETCF